MPVLHWRDLNLIYKYISCKRSKNGRVLIFLMEQTRYRLHWLCIVGRWRRNWVFDTNSNLLSQYLCNQMGQTEFKVLISKVFYIGLQRYRAYNIRVCDKHAIWFSKEKYHFFVTYFNIKSSFPSKIINNYSGYKKSNNSSDLNMTIYIIKIKLIFFYSRFKFFFLT